MRVLGIAAEMNYEPNVSAKSLASQTSNLISAVIPMLTNYFFLEVIRGIQDALMETEFELLVYSASTPDHMESQIQCAMQRGRSEGTLVFSYPLGSKLVKKMKASGKPVVLVDSVHREFDSVAVDSVEGGRLGAQHLVGQGYSRIALIMGHPESVPAAERKTGYVAALREAGLPVDPSLVIASTDAERHGFNESFGHEAMVRLLALDNPPDAVFATSDMQALGALRALRGAGLRVPEEVGVVGFDDIMVSRYVGLTTLRQPMYDIGRVSVGKLLDAMSNGNAQIAPTVFSPALIVRETSVPES